MQRYRAKMKLKLAIGKKMHLNGQKPTYYLTNAFTLGNFALECFFTLILLVLVLGDWTIRSAASPARLVVQLILVHFLTFFRAM